MNLQLTRNVHRGIYAVAAMLSLAPLAVAQGVTHYGCQANEILTAVNPADLDHMGQSIAVGGDFNGDGFRDIAIGGYNRPPAGSTNFKTRAFVFLGTGNSSSPFFRHALTIEGPYTLDLFGFAVAFIGDLNNDQCNELVVGAPRFDGPGMPDSGRVSVFLGNPQLSAQGSGDPQVVQAYSSQYLSFDGMVEGGWFGASLATAQDTNGEFLLDLLIGAPGLGPVDPPTLFGSTYQLEGSTILASAAVAATASAVPISANPMPGTPGLSGSVSSGLVATAHRLLTGNAAGDRFGNSLAFVGNLDGVGGQEFLVGAPQWTAEQPGLSTTGPGYAQLYKLSSATPLITIWGTQVPTSVEPRHTGEAFGFSVAGGVKLDEDAVPDLIIGSPLFDVDQSATSSGLTSCGRVRAFSGADALINVESVLLPSTDVNGTRMVGTAGSDQFGFAVAGVPDVNADGRDDVLVGACQAALGSVTVCNPHSQERPNLGGAAYIYTAGSTLAGDKIVTFFGEKFKDHLGRAVAACQLFGSSVPEIVLSGLGYSEAGLSITETGRAYVWKGDTVAQ